MKASFKLLPVFLLLAPAASHAVKVPLPIEDGLSAYGPSSITAVTAGYVPTSLDPITATGPRRQFTNSLANPAFKSLLVHWNVLF